MSWLLLMVAPALAGEYRRLELADGRSVAVEVVGNSAVGLDVVVPQGRMQLPYEQVANITPMSVAEWQALPALRILFLPVVTDPAASPAAAQAADLQLRAELRALPKTTVLQLGELPVEEGARAQLRSCRADPVCLEKATEPLPVDVTLVGVLGGSAAAPALTLTSTWRGYPGVHMSGGVAFDADPEARRVAASSSVHDALGLLRVNTPLAPIVTAPSTSSSPWTVLGVEDPMVAVLPTGPLAPPPAAIPAAVPAAAAPAAAPDAATLDTPWATPAASAPVAVAVPPASPSTPAVSPPETPGPASSVPAAPPPAASAPAASAPDAAAPVQSEATINGGTAAGSRSVSPALAFVPLPGFPEWAAGDPAHGLLATALVVPGTAVIVYASGASASRPGEFLALSGVGYYALCVATSRAFLPVVTPTAGGATFGIAGAW